MENTDVVDTTNESVDTQKSDLVDAKKETKESKVYDEGYVKKLESESMKRRLRIKELETTLTEIENSKLEAERNALIEQGKFKELFEKEQAEKAQLMSKISEYEPIVSKYQESINAKRAELVALLPEYMQKEFGNDSIEKLEILAKQFQNVNRNSIGNLPIDNNAQPKKPEFKSKGFVIE